LKDRCDGLLDDHRSASYFWRPKASSRSGSTRGTEIGFLADHLPPYCGCREHSESLLPGPFVATGQRNVDDAGGTN
jgi:hypothetical protein